jgi:glutaredoxin 2
MALHITSEDDTMTDVKLHRTIVIITLALVLIPIAVHAQTIVEQQTPAERCSLTQNYLKTIQKPRDLRARVDRLQAYRYIYQRLDVFVIRLEKNGQPQATELRSTLETYSDKTEAFKNDYERYDKAREDLANMKDCKNSIEKFQQQLQTTRELRQKVHEDIQNIQALLSPEITGQLEVLHEKLLATERTRAN